jgi:hypothetical protein
MGSTYTDSGGIEKIGLGEQAGAWGTTTNNNFDIIDRLINGVGAITLSGTSHTLTTSDGSLSDGMFKVLVLGGSPSGTNTITIDPPNADKLYFVKNASGQTVTFTQGSGGDVSISNGFGAIIFADGAGSGAAVTDLTALFTTSQAIDGVNIGATTPGTGAFSALTVDNVVVNGSNIGHTDDTDLITVANGVVTVAGEVSATTLDIGGTNITSTAAELNILDGVTATASELNLVDGSSAGTIVNSKAVIYGSSGEVNATTLQIAGTSITATAAELNIMDGVTASTSELNIIDGVTATTAELNILDGVTATASELNLVDGSSAGTIVNSKAVIYGSSGEVNATTLQIAGTSITSTAAELNVLDGYTGSVTELNYLDTLHATGVTSTEFDFLDGVTSNIQTQLNTKVTSSGVTQVTGGTGLNGTVTSTGSLNLNTGLGEVGTYAFLARSGTTTITAGQTYTNSSSGADNNNAGLMYSGMLMADSNFSDNTALDATGSASTGLTGVWRAMGEANHTSRRAATLFLRIS